MPKENKILLMVPSLLYGSSTVKYQPGTPCKASSDDAQLSQLNLFSFYDSFDESRTRTCPIFPSIMSGVCRHEYQPKDHNVNAFFYELMRSIMNPVPLISDALEVVSHVTLGVTCRGSHSILCQVKTFIFPPPLALLNSHRAAFRQPFYSETESRLSSKICPSCLKTKVD